MGYVPPGQLRCFIGARLLKVPAVYPSMTLTTTELRNISAVHSKWLAHAWLCVSCELPNLGPGDGS